MAQVEDHVRAARSGGGEVQLQGGDSGPDGYFRVLPAGLDGSAGFLCGLGIGGDPVFRGFQRQSGLDQLNVCIIAARGLDIEYVSSLFQFSGSVRAAGDLSGPAVIVHRLGCAEIKLFVYRRVASLPGHGEGGVALGSQPALVSDSIDQLVFSRLFNDGLASGEVDGRGGVYYQFGCKIPLLGVFHGHAAQGIELRSRLYRLVLDSLDLRRSVFTAAGRQGEGQQQGQRRRCKSAFHNGASFQLMDASRS